MADELTQIEPELTKEEFESLVPGLLKLNQWLKPKIKQVIETNKEGVCDFLGLRFYQVKHDTETRNRLLLCFGIEYESRHGIDFSYFDVQLRLPGNPPLIKED